MEESQFVERLGLFLVKNREWLDFELDCPGTEDFKFSWVFYRRNRPDEIEIEMKKHDSGEIPEPMGELGPVGVVKPFTACFWCIKLCANPQHNLGACPCCSWTQQQAFAAARRVVAKHTGGKLA